MPAEPQPAGPQPAGPQPARPHPARPHPAGPHPAGPQPAGPRPAEDGPPLTGASWRTDLFDIPEYLRCIGLDAAPAADPAPDLLAALHEAHVRALPFANLDVLLRTHPGVAPDAVQDRLVRRGRGGYCFEHAQLFAAAAEHLGFPVRRALGRVHTPVNTRTHMTVTAASGGRNWMCDPGFGYSLLRPLPLEDGAEQDLGGRVARLERLGGPVPVWVLSRDGSPEHYTDELPVQPADVRAGHFVTAGEPRSPFRSHLMVMRHMPYGHVTVTEGARTVRAAGQATEHTEITVAEVIDGVRELGVRLQDGEDARLAAAVARLRRA